MWTPPDPPLTTLTLEDPELIRLVLENMSYLEIVDWCNASPHFRGLCEVPDSLIGEYIYERRRRETIGSFSTDHNVPDGVFGLDELSVDPDSSHFSSLSIRINGLYMQVEDAEAIMLEIIIRQTDEGEDFDPSNFIFFSEETESGSVQTGIEIHVERAMIYSRFYPTDEESPGWSHETLVDNNFIKSVFGAALMAYRRNVEIGDYVIFSDYTVHSAFGEVFEEP